MAKSFVVYKIYENVTHGKERIFVSLWNEAHHLASRFEGSLISKSLTSIPVIQRKTIEMCISPITPSLFFPGRGIVFQLFVFNWYTKWESSFILIPLGVKWGKIFEVIDKYKILIVFLWACWVQSEPFYRLWSYATFNI